MKYGEQQTITKLDDVTTTVTEKIIGGTAAKTIIKQTEMLKVNDPKQVLAEFLKLLDRQSSGEISAIIFECVPSKFKPGIIHRVKMSWICNDL
jgi:hypothetical protein